MPKLSFPTFETDPEHRWTVRKKHHPKTGRPEFCATYQTLNTDTGRWEDSYYECGEIDTLGEDATDRARRYGSVKWDPMTF